MKDARAPKNFEEMWAGLDPRAERLEVETLKEWKEDDVVLRVVRFRIGVFKGKKAKLAAIYGFPKTVVGTDKRLIALGSTPCSVARRIGEVTCLTTISMTP